MPDLAFDPAGYCVVAVDQCVINLELDGSREVVVLYSLIGQPTGNTDAVHAAALRANYLGLQLGGPALGLRPSDGALVLSQLVSAGLLDLESFEAILQNFVEVTEEWIRKLPELGMPVRTIPSGSGVLRA